MKTAKLSENTLHPLYSTLSLFEQIFFRPPAQCMKDRTETFTLLLPWAIRSDFLYQHLRLFRKNIFKIPGLQGKHLLPLMLSLEESRLSLTSRSVAFQVKSDMTRLRAFYRPEENRPAVSVKILKTNHASPERMLNKIEKRQLIESFGTISLPKTISTGVIEDYTYIVEELIEGRRFSFRKDIHLFISQALPELVSTYRLAGIRQENIAGLFPSDLPQKLSELHLNNKGLQHMASILDDAFKTQSTVDVSLCHGDLVSSNLCRSHGKIYFLDWDCSDYKPIIPDLLRIGMKHAPKASPLLDGIKEALSPIQQANPAIGLTATLAQRMVKLPRQQKELLSLWKRHYPLWNNDPALM